MKVLESCTNGLIDTHSYVDEYFEQPKQLYLLNDKQNGKLLAVFDFYSNTPEDEYVTKDDT